LPAFGFASLSLTIAKGIMEFFSQVEALFEGCNNFIVRSFLNFTSGYGHPDPVTGIKKLLPKNVCTSSGKVTQLR